MSIIAVEGLNLQISLFQVGKMLAKCINGSFEPLSFMPLDGSFYKTCYLQLSDKLDPQEVIERINITTHGKKRTVLNAYIPEEIPNFPDMQKKVGIAEVKGTSDQVLSVAHTEIMTELQYKYTGLYNLSNKGSHTLLDAIGMTIYDRLKQLVATGDDSASPFILTGRYRKAYPHFGDFHLILGTLHRLEDAAGAPRTQLQESELTATAKDIMVIDKVPYTKALQAISKYTEKITKKLEEHVGNYDSTVNPEDGEAEVARKKVQTQLSKMMPYLPAIMKQVVTNHFAEDHRKNRYHKMRMYGEPFLPSKELTLSMLKPFFPNRAFRWKNMYNLLVLDVPQENYSKLMALDGTTLSGSKLIIRSSVAPIYRGKLSRKKSAAEIDIDDNEEADSVIEL